MYAIRSYYECHAHASQRSVAGDAGSGDSAGRVDGPTRRDVVSARPVARGLRGLAVGLAHAARGLARIGKDVEILPGDDRVPSLSGSFDAAGSRARQAARLKFRRAVTAHGAPQGPWNS